MKVVAISDLHGFLEKPKNMPEGDILCICGDIVPLEYQSDDAQSIAWFCLEFVPWIDELPYKKVLLIAGNHDFFLENLHKRSKFELLGTPGNWRSPSDVLKKLLPGNNKSKHSKLVYLCDNSVEIEGKRFYGTPWIADLERWAFYLPEEQLREKYKQIPKKCDVLMTHMPPKLCGIGQVQQKYVFNSFADYGSVALADAILGRDITWSISGHVHSGIHYPQVVDESHFAVNCSVKDEEYKVSYSPIIFEV